MTDEYYVSRECGKDIIRKKTDEPVTPYEIVQKVQEQQKLIEELYTFRLLYNAHLFNEWHKNQKHEVYKSRRHDDGTLCYDGEYFIVVANLPTGQITNHYHICYYDLFHIPEHEKVKDKFDGHDSNKVIDRLMRLLRQDKEEL